MAKAKSVEVEEKESSPIEAQESVQEIVQPEVVKKEAPKEIHPFPQLDENVSFEDKIVAFLKSRPAQGHGFVSISSFLKSTYPLPKLGEPPLWTRQQESKALKAKISDAINSGKIAVNGEHYKKLGSFYYADGKPETQYHNLSTIQIEAKLV